MAAGKERERKQLEKRENEYKKNKNDNFIKLQYEINRKSNNSGESKMDM